MAWRAGCAVVCGRSGQPDWASGPPVPGGGECASGLAPDVSLVGLEDQIRPALSVAEQSCEQRRCHFANRLDVLRGVGCAGDGDQVVNLILDQGVFANETGHRPLQPRRCDEQLAVEPVEAFGESDVLAEVGGELDKRDVHAFGPGRLATGCRRGQCLSTARIDSSSSARRRRWPSNSFCSVVEGLGSIEASVPARLRRPCGATHESQPAEPDEATDDSGAFRCAPTPEALVEPSMPVRHSPREAATGDRHAHRRGTRMTAALPCS